MPLFVPVLIGAAVIGATGFGLKKSYDGVSNLSRARGISTSAGDRHGRAVDSLDRARSKTNHRAAEYTEAKIAALQGPIRQFLDVMDQLRLKTSSKDVDGIAGIDLTPEEVAEYRTALVEVKRLGAGALTATAAGAAASHGTLMLVGSYGAASTGTAIAGLSGAAAHSATLALLGGGSLAAGGWGMAGGTVVLGGITVAPLLAISGMTLAMQGEKALLPGARNAEESAAVLRVVLEMYRELCSNFAGGGGSSNLGPDLARRQGIDRELDANTTRGDPPVNSTTYRALP